MALFNRLFQSRKAGKAERSNQEDVKPFTFNTGQVRVLLFRECEWRGRKLLYDSSAVEKVSLDNAKIVSKCFSNNKTDEINEKYDSGISNDLNIMERSNGFGFQCKVMNSDAILLGEMIFGSVAMNYKGMSLKVHILNAPQRLMYTKVYCSPGRRRCRPHTTDTSRQPSISSDSAASITDVLHKTATQVTDLCSSSYSNSVDSSVPFQVSVLNIEDHLSVNWCVNKDDSGFCSEFSSHSSIGCNCSSDSNSCIWDKENCTNHAEELFHFGNSGDMKESSVPRSLQWRLNHHTSTSLDYSTAPVDSSSQVTSNSKDPQASTNNLRNTTSESLTSNSGKSSYQRKEKMGLAIVITLTEKIESQMLRFLMEHAVLVEGALSRLRLAVREALSKPHAFITNMAAATQEAAQWLVDLLTCPRIGAPLWSFLSCSQKRTVGDKIADIFLKDLCSLLCTMDTKETYFFMSTLITNVLTHHLGWVNSVSPYNISSLSQQKELDILNNLYPYNPLWAQLGELYGVIGTPSRISRTIIYGKQNVCVVKKILNVLSYFIRCGEVKRLCVKTKPVSWDSIDYFMKNYNTENIASEHSIKKDKPKRVSGDMIEMKTFKVTTNQPSSFKELKPTSTCVDTNLHTKTFVADPILHKSVGSCSDTKHNCKLKSSLKRNVSSNKLHNAFSKTSTNSLDSSNSSINSICTLRPIDSSEKCSDGTSENNCFSSTNRTLKKTEKNLSGIQSKVNKLCRVSTSTTLCQIENEIDEVIDNSDLIEESTPPNISVKLDCDKQIRVCEDICSNSSNAMKSSEILKSDSVEDLKKELNDLQESSCKKNVVFVLGEDEVLEGLKKISTKNPSSEIEKTSNTKCAEVEVTGTDITEAENKRCKSYPRENTSVTSDLTDRLSLQRDTCCMRKPQCKHSKFKKHSGVKFEFEKYPQIVTNYMKSKNLELLDRHVIGKPGNLKIDAFEFEAGSSILSVPEDSDTCINCSFNGQSLQTPSNASELEYTCDIPDQREIQFAKEKIILPTIVTHVEPNNPPKVFIKQKLEQTLVVNSTKSEPTESTERLESERELLAYNQSTASDQDESVEFPLPVMALSPECDEIATGYCHSLLGGITDHYVSDLVLQGGVGGKRDDWERLLRRDLASQGGATCLLADIDDGSVRAWGGGAVGMSALVASMLDSVPQMCHAKVPPTQCLAYIESKLKELCVRSKTLAQLLMEKDFCDMDYLTKTLNLDPNDVPLLLAIASTHSPEVTLKYGVSYR